MARQSPISHCASRLLRSAKLGPAYEKAFVTWEQTGSAAEWESTVGDGLRPDALFEIEERPADG